VATAVVPGGNASAVGGATTIAQAGAAAGAATAAAFRSSKLACASVVGQWSGEQVCAWAPVAVECSPAAVPFNLAPAFLLGVVASILALPPTMLAQTFCQRRHRGRGSAGGNSAAAAADGCLRERRVNAEADRGLVTYLVAAHFARALTEARGAAGTPDPANDSAGEAAGAEAAPPTGGGSKPVAPAPTKAREHDALRARFAAELVAERELEEELRRLPGEAAVAARLCEVRHNQSTASAYAIMRALPLSTFIQHPHCACAQLVSPPPVLTHGVALALAAVLRACARYWHSARCNV
jgi:hypothetical protein